MSKVCNGCKQDLPIESFSRRQSWCKACRRKYVINNYSHGKVCSVCAVPIVNRSTTGFCRKHYGASRIGKRPDRRTLNVNGYVVINNKHGHPNAWSRGEMLEHVFVMSEALGRALLPDENVHHINGVRDDNRLENLELWSSSQPCGQRVDQKADWAIEILRRYRPEALAEVVKERVSLRPAK